MPTDVSPLSSLSLSLFWGLLLAVGVGRLMEMRLSRRNQRKMAEQGARRLPERGFGLMVGLHTGVLVSAAVEAWLCQRPFIAGLAIPALVAVALANGLRWWVIRTLDRHWNVQVMDSLALGVVTGGPTGSCAIRTTWRCSWSCSRSRSCTRRT